MYIYMYMYIFLRYVTENGRKLTRTKKEKKLVQLIWALGTMISVMKRWFIFHYSFFLPRVSF